MEELRQVIRSAINFKLGEMTRSAEGHWRCVCVVALAGSTTMRDIIFGLDVPLVGVKPCKSLSELEWAALRPAAFPVCIWPGGSPTIAMAPMPRPSG